MGGTLALAADAGHRVVLVFATRGDLGEVADGVLEPDEALGRPARGRGPRRGRRARRGPRRVPPLPRLRDGRASPPTTAPGAFPAPTSTNAATAARGDPARRGRPRCSPSTTSAAATGTPTTSRCTTSAGAPPSSRGTPRVYTATVSKEHFLALQDEMRDAGARRRSTRPTPRRSSSASPPRASPRRSTSPSVLDRKRAAMAAHPSQIPAESFFLALPDDAFRRAFGTEWFIRLDETPAEHENWIF